MNKNSNVTNNRIRYIDAIRGIATLFVVFCHISCVFLPGLYYEEVAKTPFEKVWLSSPLNIITNGNAAVQCFFVLSGFLITRKIYNKKSISSPYSTYIKLLKIVAPSILIMSMLMHFNLLYHLEALKLDNTLLFVEEYNNFDVSLLDTIYDIFIRTFFFSSNYVGPFWTMKYELLGSSIISAISFFIFEKTKKRKLNFLFFGFLVMFINSTLFPFIAGAFTYECIYSNYGEQEYNLLDKIIIFIQNRKLLLLSAFYLGLYLFTVNRDVSSIWKPLHFLSPATIRIIGFSILLFCINESAFLKKLLDNRFLKFLGQISAYIYSFHWHIILSIGCYLFLLLHDIPYYLVVTIISVVVIIVSIVASYLYSIMVANIKRQFILFRRFISFQDD